MHTETSFNINADKFQQAVNFYQKGQLEQAEALCKEIVEIQPQHADTLHLLGVIMAQQRKYQKAFNFINQSIAINPNNIDALNNHGNVLKDLKRYEEALASYNLALAIKPDYADALNNRGNVLIELKRFDEALTSFDYALKIKPDFAQAFNNRGSVLKNLNIFNEALVSYDNALAIKPDYADALNNRGIVLMELKRFDEAIASFDYALKIKSDDANGHWNKSLCQLLLGNFTQGWRNYEWRWQTEQFRNSYRSFNQPLWLGEDSLLGKSILLHGEQGLGDTLQFCRYIKEVKALGATVLLGVQPILNNVLNSLQGVDVFLKNGDLTPNFDYHCPLLSLPLAFKTDLETIPADIPYLFAEKEKLAIGNKY